MDINPTNSFIELQENFEDFFEKSLCGFIITDNKGLILRANSIISDWTNYPKEAFTEKRFSDLLSIGGKIYFETHLWPLLRMQGFFDEVVLELNHHNGKKLRVMINALERRDEKDQVQFIRFTIIKASDRLQYELNLQESKKQTEAELQKQKEMVTLREQFISVLGHDLRNPLSAVTMAVELLDSSPEADNSRLVSTLKRSSARMSELVMNIMDFARTRLGENIIIARQETPLEPLLQQLVAEMQLVYPKKEISTLFQLDHSVYCDPHRISQLVSNLLANALVHGDTGSPVHLQAVETNGQLTLSVKNQGHPIPQVVRDHLFTPFTREESRPSQHGLGLGLYICAKIAQAHGGTLNFTSDETETCFTLNMEMNATA
ncbi:MAG: HAMP domain-containing sensor histidine kinase [Ginsengibacter sp.]